MPIPLLWLGAGLAAGYSALRYADKEHANRQSMGASPGTTTTPVAPGDGSIVCCGIYGVFEHTGIWVDGRIIELAGNGLVRAVSPERFLQHRSGEHIFVACNEAGEPLAEDAVACRAAHKVYTYMPYNLIDNNCHQLCASLITDSQASLTGFGELNNLMAACYQSKVFWQPAVWDAGRHVF